MSYDSAEENGQTKETEGQAHSRKEGANMSDLQQRRKIKKEFLGVFLTEDIKWLRAQSKRSTILYFSVTSVEKMLLQQKG